MKAIPERQWKLGEDLFPEDSLLDGFTFEDVITVLKSNCQNLTPTEAKKELRELVDSKLEDMYFLFENNCEEMLKIARSRRSDCGEFFDEVINGKHYKKNRYGVLYNGDFEVKFGIVETKDFPFYKVKRYDNQNDFENGKNEILAYFSTRTMAYIECRKMREKRSTSR